MSEQTTEPNIEEEQNDAMLPEDLENEIKAIKDPDLKDKIIKEKERLLSKIGNSKLARTAVAGLLSLTMLAGTTKEAYAEEPKPAGVNDVLEKTTEKTNAFERARTILGELNSKVKAEIGDLGMFAKIGLVKDIKKQAESIKKLAYEGNISVIDEAGEPLRTILNIYYSKLEPLKNSDQDTYKIIVENLLGLVKAVQTKSLNELKKDPRFS